MMFHLDIVSQLELGKPVDQRKPEKRVNGIFWILLINIGIFVADHVFQVSNHFILFQSFAISYYEIRTWDAFRFLYSNRSIIKDLSALWDILV